MLNKIIEWGAYLLVFLLPLQTRYIFKYGSLNGSYWEYGTFSLYLTDIVLLFLLGALAWQVFGDKKYKGSIPLYWLSLASLELVAFISIFFSVDTTAALIGYARLLLGIGMFTLIVKANFRVNLLLLSFVSGALLQALLSVWQFLTQTSFSSKWLGMAVHVAADLGTSVVEVAGGGRWLRAYGSFDHPNILGVYLCLAMMFAIILLGRLKYARKVSPKAHFTLYFSFALLLLGMCFSFSRSAWLAFAVGLMLYALQIFKYNSPISKKAYAYLLIIVFLIIGMFASMNFNLIRTRLGTQTRLEQISVNERLESYTVAEQIFSKNKLWGVGMNNYSFAYAEIYPGEQSWYYQPVHNVYYLVLTEIGILGVFALLLVLFTIIIHSGWDECIKNPLTPVLAIMLFAFIFDHWWWSSHFGLILFFLLLGLFVNKSETEI